MAAVPYAAGRLPDEPELRSVRCVDGCSRQCYAVRRVLFESLGGLSGEFWPGVGAHLDLAFGVRAQGFRTLIQPLARVSEFRRSTRVGEPGQAERFAAADAAALRRRWSKTLDEHGSNTGPDAIWAGSNRHPRGMVLVCDNDVPSPDRDSGSRRMDGIIRILSDLGYAVYLAPGMLRALEPYSAHIGQRGVTVLASAEAQSRFIREAGRQLRAVLLSRPAVAHKYLKELYTHAPDAVLMFDTVDLHSLRLWRESWITRIPVAAREWSSWGTSSTHRTLMLSAGSCVRSRPWSGSKSRRPR